MRVIQFTLAVALVCLLCAGCATSVTRSPGLFHDDGLYPATRFDAEILNIFEVNRDWHTYPARIIGGTLDLPFSLVIDTLLLPYDLYNNSQKEE